MNTWLDWQSRGTLDYISHSTGGFTDNNSLYVLNGICSENKIETVVKATRMRSTNQGLLEIRVTLLYRKFLAPYQSSGSMSHCSIYTVKPDNVSFWTINKSQKILFQIFINETLMTATTPRGRYGSVGGVSKL